MRVRLISGSYGGRFIASPDTSRTHPMSERIRGALFNMLGDLQGVTVLDAFAGTGALGLEALSRGAKRVVFIERDRAAQKILAENIALLQVSESAVVAKGSVSSWCESASGQKFDIVFADPPYQDTQFQVLNQLKNHIQSNGLMVLSYPGRESAPTVNGVVVVDKRSYGDAALAVYRLQTAS